MSDEYIKDIILDERTIVWRNADIEHERKVAIFDLLEHNLFAPVGEFRGPYILRLSIEENRLVFDVRDENDSPLARINLPTTPFRNLIKEYFVVCGNYFEAIKTGSPSQIEAIDMGRRALHNDGTEMLLERLKGKADLDFDTSRRLFTLICVLHIRG